MRLLRLLSLSMVTLVLLAGCSKEPQAPKLNATEGTLQAPSRIFAEGQHYSTLQNPVIEPELSQYVTEYFWLGCPHCQNFEPVLKGYLKDRPQVTLVRKHPALGERWAFDASIFYALQQSGNEHLTEALFELYRTSRVEQSALPNVQTINAFLSQHKLDPEQLSTLANSQDVRQAMEQANREMLDNRINGVPSLVVKGRYLVSDSLPADIQSTEDYYQLLDYLLTKP